MSNQTYVCLGNCQALISDEEYKNGLTACGNNTCNLKEQPFVKGDKCEYCRKNYVEDQKHQH